MVKKPGRDRGPGCEEDQDRYFYDDNPEEGFDDEEPDLFEFTDPDDGESVNT